MLGQLSAPWWQAEQFKLFQILAEIDEAIGTGLPRAIIKDLHVLKLTFRTSISEFIDDFTYKILSNIERDME